MPARTWVEEKNDEGETVRWSMLVDGEPLDGAYVSLAERGSYEIHFPRLVPSIVPSLPVALETLENAPLTKRKGIAIGRQAGEADRSLFSTVDEVADGLGVSRSRINAMVANGVLAASRFEGEVMVSKSSVDRYRSAGQEPGARGRFANKFVQYLPDRGCGEYYLLEVDAFDEDQIAYAEEFVRSIRENERHPGGARLVGYRTAMKLRNSKCCIRGDGGEPIGLFVDFPTEEHLVEYGGQSACRV